MVEIFRERGREGRMRLGGLGAGGRTNSPLLRAGATARSRILNFHRILVNSVCTVCREK